MKRGRVENSCQGSSLVYVIFLVTLLVTVSCGYMAVVQKRTAAAAGSAAYREAGFMARSIHRTFCESVSRGRSRAMGKIWEKFDQDCAQLWEEYKEEHPEQEGSWEEYMEEFLGYREYEAKGEGSTEDPRIRVAISLWAEPLQQRVFVNTEVSARGYQFALGAEIRFDTDARPAEDFNGNRIPGTDIFRRADRVYRYFEGEYCFLTEGYSSLE